MEYYHKVNDSLSLENGEYGKNIISLTFTRTKDCNPFTVRIDGEGLSREVVVRVTKSTLREIIKQANVLLELREDV